MDRSGVEPGWPIPAVYLLHGKGGSPEGTVKKLHAIFGQRWPGLNFHRPLLPHHDPGVPCEASIEHLLRMQIPRNALLALSKPEYFTILMPDSEAGPYRIRARTPKELLRRNVVLEGRNMTLL